MNAILVVGGAGYIGSHMVLELLKRNIHVVVLDNLITVFVFGMDVFGEQGQNGVSINNGAFGYPI